MIRGLVVGKFYPPHLGHSHLIETALQQSDRLDVLVVDNPRYGIPAATRRNWLKTLHPKAYFHIIDDIDDDDNSAHWATHTIELLGYAPDIVFSSEDYGDTYAKYLGATHVAVDKPRHTFPVSGTVVRKDTVSQKDFLSGVVKEALAIRIVVIGAESTGTTTLTKALATHYRAAWVPEIGRYYTESLLPSRFRWEDRDFLQIATMQQNYEATIAHKSGGLIFCDTNATATTLWQQRYMGHIGEEVAEVARQDIVNAYLLTGDEIPFEDDGTRDGEHIRHDMHNWFVDLVKESGKPFIILRGSPKERLQKATTFIDSLLPDLRTIHDS